MLIVANFKMNGSSKFYAEIQNKLNDEKIKDTIVLCPPFVYISNFNLTNKKIFLGSQDISMNENTKSTGQISPQMLKEFKVKYSIIGHSERRELGETDAQIAQKTYVALKNGIVPIVCVGEQSKENGTAEIKKQTNYVLKQLVENLKKLTNEKSDINQPKINNTKIDIAKTNSTKFNFAKIDLNKIVFAYEPVWAIGTHHTAINQQIDKVAKLIKTECKKFNLDCKVLYGGSVNGENYNTLKTCAIDGMLVGSAALNINEFLKIIKG